VKRCGGVKSGASDLDPTAQIACKRWPVEGGETMAAADGERRRGSGSEP
jgi:hypothetical protein